ncbi:MAG: MFS transporter [Dehalococcoidia bacterium]|nr:MFS transporter [Dehalococcoidia bacterium]MCB9484641.1 MFS transporter [Thermoflexaceae bacterium]
MASERIEAPAGQPGAGSGVSATVRGWFNRTFDSLRNRNLRILWIGTLLNFAGVTMNQTAQGVVAFDLTGNSRAVGTVMLGSGLSLLFISPLAGALADRVSKRTMLISCQAITAATFFFVGFAITAGFINIPLLAVAAFVSGTMFAMIRSVRNAYIGELATTAQRGNAVAVQQLAMTVMMVSGPFAAGILIGWDAFGSAGTYTVMGGAFTLAIITMLQLPATSAPKRSTGAPNLLRDSWIGMQYGWKNPEIRWVLGGFLLLTIVGNPYITLLPGYAKEELGVSTANLGMLLGVSAVGGFIVSLGAASMADSPKATHLLGACNILFGVSLVGLCFAPNLGMAATVMLFLGAGASGFQVLNLAVALRAAEVAYMGRVAALTMMASSLSSIVALPVGILADRYGERPMLGTMGVAVLAVAFVLIIWRNTSPTPDTAISAG